MNVGQHPLDGDTAVSKPRLSSVQEPDGGLAGLIRMDLGVGQPGVVIDRGVDEPMAGQRVMVAAYPAT